MATCANHLRRLDPDARECTVRVLRWLFRRQDDAVVCVLGLNGDDLAYELRLDPAPTGGATVESFDNAMSAFERQASIERTLVHQGWTLEAFESEQVRRGI